ncbi:MAG: DUF2973 domain-containing protein [Synechococcales cyanobacterium C42_A2020_086]|jgi:hypothetical protein|nr:DUF2973 domain-containing protein [Synechococcales cyanobacterium C42_A2020_086]
MLHLIYILAFTVLAFLAVGNLIRNLMMLGMESQRSYGNRGRFVPNASESGGYSQAGRLVPHPELLDDHGNVVNEPFLVMRSMTVEDARERLDALYEASPSVTDDPQSETQG